jgi:hypothetical protein
MLIDARIPVHFTDHVPETARADQALVLPDGAGTSRQEQYPGWAAVLRLPDPSVSSVTVGHAPGCSCCGGRSGLAIMLTRLFQARARGEVGFFSGVVASLPAPAMTELRGALLSDSFVSACFVEAKAVE